jgi:pimeloyl-ACP methyl ester carboxylesterase
VTSARRSCSSCTEGRAAYTLALYDTDLEAVRAATGAARVHLIGHSWGGLLALRFAIARPGEFASLVLADGIPPTSKTFEAGETRFAGRVSSRPPTA